MEISIEEMSRRIEFYVKEKGVAEVLIQVTTKKDKTGDGNLKATYALDKKTTKISTHYDKGDPDYDTDSENPTRKGKELLLGDNKGGLEVTLLNIEKGSAIIKISRNPMELTRMKELEIYFTEEIDRGVNPKDLEDLGYPKQSCYS